ncbi:MAG: permease-like cell division protein FtsX [Bacteroidales bacterium]
MARQEEKIIGRRLKTSYITTVASISLVLFVLGLLGLTILFAQRLSDHVKENIGFTVFIRDNASISEITALQQTFEAMDAVRATEYVSREKAAEELKADLGEDFVEFLGYNPLSASILISMNAGYANPDSLEVFERQVASHPSVAEVDYQKDLVHLVNENVRKIGIGLAFFSALLLMIAFALINNTIRLSVFSKRFLIKSMQLIGATQGFIRRPFVMKGVIQGLISAIIAITVLTAGMYTVEKKMPGLALFSDAELLLILFGLVLFFGITISWISTFFAVRKYLKVKTDSLYYY